MGDSGKPSNSAKTRKIAFLALMLVLVIFVNLLETLYLSPLMPPGTRPGLSNIFVMFVAIFEGAAALGLGILKSLFVFATRGAIAGMISAAGGLVSILLVLFVLRFFGRVSYAALGMIGALAHNMGQFLAAMALLRTAALLYYLPMLVITAIITGAVSGMLLRLLLPALSGAAGTHSKG